jgi:predicted nucleic acid-binding Zn ribbon protein
MPVYVYEVIHADGSPGERFEIHQSIKDEPLRRHPDSGEPVQRVILAPSLTLKHGSGHERKMLENSNLDKKGFTKYERDRATGTYHRVAGKEGPETFQR